MQSFGHRGYWNTVHKPRGVTRVLCMGDSLTFGQGVEPQQAWPAVLEENLNRFCWERPVEVVNDAVCGYSLHDAAMNFRQRGHRLAPDVAVLGLCDNDAEFHTAGKEGYRAHSDANWAPEGTVFALFLKALAALRNEVSRRGIPLVVCYLSINGDCGTQRAIAERIGATAQELGINFLDVSREFTGPQAATNNAKAYVSVADGHPSESSHRIIAMRLARHLLTEGPLRGGASAPLPEREVVERCVKAARGFVTNGRPAESACHWLHGILTAKRQCRARVRLPVERLVPDGEHARRLAALEAEYATMMRLNWHQAQAALVDDQQFTTLSGYQRALERVNKMCFLLESATPETPFLQPEFECLAAAGINAGKRSLPLNDLAQRAASLRNAAHAVLDRLRECGELLARPGTFLPMVRGRMDATIPLAFCLEEIFALADGCREAATRLDTLLSRACTALSENSKHGVALLQRHLNGILERLEAIAADIGLALCTTPPPPATILPQTRIGVRLTVPEGRRGTVRLTAFSTQPSRAPVMEIHHAVADGMPHIYTYVFPTLINATVSIELVGHDKGMTLADILGDAEVGPNSPAPTTVSPDGLVWESPVKAWLHLALIRP